MIRLPFVTLVAVSSIEIPRTIKGLEFSCRNIDFGEVKLITHEDVKHPTIKVETCDNLDTIDKYNYYVFLELWKHIDTEFALIQQYDSCVLWETEWKDSWLEWDYIGSPWPIVENSYMGNDGTRSRVGNGGFSLRHKKLLQIPYRNGWGLRSEQGYASEDGNICCYWKKEMLKEGIKYAPVEIASHFSFENYVPENENIIKTFGFHKNWRKEWLHQTNSMS
jgi:hypothetical protein